MGLALGCVGLFGIGILVGAMPLAIDFSPDSFTVTGDEVADRYRAIRAARRRSSQLSPLRLEQVLVSSPPPPPLPPTPTAAADGATTTFEFEQLTFLQLYVTIDEALAPPAGLLDDEILPRIKALQDSLFRLPQLGRLCKRGGSTGPMDGTAPDGDCSEPHGLLSLLYAEQAALDRYTDVQVPLPVSQLSALTTAAAVAISRSRLGPPPGTGRVNTSNFLVELAQLGVDLATLEAPPGVLGLLNQPTLSCHDMAVEAGSARGSRERTVAP